VNIDDCLDGHSDDPDLDALMARVREAAGVGESAASPAGEKSEAAACDLGRVLAAQAAWNERTTRSLALIVECLQNLQDAWQQLDRSVRAERDGASSRPKGRRRRAVRARRSRSARSGGGLK
jgi:hypothetical protein